MKSDKGCFIKEIKDGQAVDGLFMIGDVNRGETRNGAPYLMLTVADSSGSMAGRVWQDADRLQAVCVPGSVVRLAGQAQAYKGVMQLKVSRITPVDDAAIDLTEFLPATDGNVKVMQAALLALVDSVEDPDLWRLLQTFFRETSFFCAFCQAPAAKKLHHAYIGGLLEHTLSVAKLADSLCPLYPGVDRSLLLAGAMLHDIGKVVEFSFNVHPFSYTDSGRLLGHLVIGVEMVQQKITALPDFPDELALRLKHLILSHHGRHEFGAPALPMMTEAFVLHYLDDLDAKIAQLEGLSRQMQEPGYGWTDYQKTLERFLYIKGRPQQDEASDAVSLPAAPPAASSEETPEETPTKNTLQPSLFG